MASKRCPIGRLTDVKTKQPACVDWCPINKCIFEDDSVISYKATHFLLEQREKILKSNKKFRNNEEYQKRKARHKRDIIELS